MNLVASAELSPGLRWVAGTRLGWSGSVVISGTVRDGEHKIAHSA